MLVTAAPTRGRLTVARTTLLAVGLVVAAVIVLATCLTRPNPCVVWVQDLTQSSFGPAAGVAHVRVAPDGAELDASTWTLRRVENTVGGPHTRVDVDARGPVDRLLARVGVKRPAVIWGFRVTAIDAAGPDGPWYAALRIPDEPEPFGGADERTAGTWRLTARSRVDDFDLVLRPDGSAATPDGPGRWLSDGSVACVAWDTGAWQLTFVLEPDGQSARGVLRSGEAVAGRRVE